MPEVTPPGRGPRKHGSGPPNTFCGRLGPRDADDPSATEGRSKAADLFLAAASALPIRFEGPMMIRTRTVESCVEQDDGRKMSSPRAAAMVGALRPAEGSDRKTISALRSRIVAPDASRVSAVSTRQSEGRAETAQKQEQPFPDREGLYADCGIALDASGLFGLVLPGRWLSTTWVHRTLHARDGS